MISVIVPVYNTGEYLPECIKSICTQSYSELQIIIIDDGSDKETAQKCDDLVAADARIEVVHKKNEGVSVARNLGLSLVRGDVVCFVDSDDTIHPEMLKSLYDAIQNTGAEIAMCDALTMLERGTEVDTIPDFEASCEIQRSDIEPATLSRLAGSAWRCAYRTDTLLRANAQFPEGIKFSEDRIFNIIAMGASQKIAYIKRPFYNRLIRRGSACFRFYPDMTDQIVAMRRILITTVRRVWGEDFVGTFERQIMGQIHLAAANYTAPTNGLNIRSQYREIQYLCKERNIANCIRQTSCNNLRNTLILGRHYIPLLILGRLTNYYHKICHKGQYQQ